MGTTTQAVKASFIVLTVLRIREYKWSPLHCGEGVSSPLWRGGLLLTVERGSPLHCGEGVPSPQWIVRGSRFLTKN